MASGDFPLLQARGDPGDPGGGNLPILLDGRSTDRTCPTWLDKEGNFGKTIVLRLEGIDTPLPKKPFLIRKSVETFLGTKIRDAQPERQGASYAIRLQSEQLAKKLTEFTMLLDETPVRVVSHPVLNKTRCVISCRETQTYTTDELLEELKEQKVIEVRRITRREGNETINTPTVILTVEGTTAPAEVFIGWIRARTRVYYPNPMKCFHCQEYGHPRTRCTAPKPICGHCSTDHDIVEGTTCELPAFCKHCKADNHSVASRQCPTYTKEVEIQKVKVDQGITYPEARRQVERSRGTTTAAKTVIESNERRFAEMEAKFTDQLGKMSQQIAKLTAVTNEKDRQLAEKERRIKNLEVQLNKYQAGTVTSGSNDSLENRLELARSHGTIGEIAAELAKQRARADAAEALLRTKHTSRAESTPNTNPKTTGNTRDLFVTPAQQKVSDLPASAKSSGTESEKQKKKNKKDVRASSKETREAQISKAERTGAKPKESSQPNIDYVKPSKSKRRKAEKSPQGSDGEDVDMLNRSIFSISSPEPSDNEMVPV